MLFSEFRGSPRSSLFSPGLVDHSQFLGTRLDRWWFLVASLLMFSLGLIAWFLFSLRVYREFVGADRADAEFRVQLLAEMQLLRSQLEESVPARSSP